MTQEEKQLLLKDLCARLPYGVKIKCIDIPRNPFYNNNETDADFELLSVRYKKGMVTIDHYGNYNLLITDCIPYLRSMSSMTEEELKWYYNKLTTIEESRIRRQKHIEELNDWLNAHHFDYRGLIEKGLALEAPKDMYKTE